MTTGILSFIMRLSANWSKKLFHRSLKCLTWSIIVSIIVLLATLCFVNTKRNWYQGKTERRFFGSRERWRECVCRRSNTNRLLLRVITIIVKTRMWTIICLRAVRLKRTLTYRLLQIVVILLIDLVYLFVVTREDSLVDWMNRGLNRRRWMNCCRTTLCVLLNLRLENSLVVTLSKATALISWGNIAKTLLKTSRRSTVRRWGWTGLTCLFSHKNCIKQRLFDAVILIRPIINLLFMRIFILCILCLLVLVELARDDPKYDRLYRKGATLKLNQQ